MRIFCKPSTALSRRAASGFTLVEVMIAALIGAVIFAGLFGGLSLGFYFVKQQRDDLRATEIMEQQIEGIRLCAWGGGSGTNIIASKLFDTNTIPRSFTTYELSGSGYNSNTVYTGTITIRTNSTPGTTN